MNLHNIFKIQILINVIKIHNFNKYIYLNSNLYKKHAAEVIFKLLREIILKPMLASMRVVFLKIHVFKSDE